MKTNISSIWRPCLRVFGSLVITGTVGEYDATTGAPIHAHFITGLKKPLGLLSGISSVPVGAGATAATTNASPTS